MILLDTNAFLWYLSDQSNFSEKIASVIRKERQTNRLLVSAISIWEIGLLVQKKRLDLGMDYDTWFSQVSKLKSIEIISINSQIAYNSITLPGDFHSDPADRMIVATAITLECTLITSDHKILEYQHVKSIW